MLGLGRFSRRPLESETLVQIEQSGAPLHIAVIGTGISGMAAAWLLSTRHRVTVYEAAPRLGGHSHTVDAGATAGKVPVDTGFIVNNEPAYPNLAALFRFLDVPTQASDMSFAVSMDDGALEYAGTDLFGLFAQKRNLFRPRFWSMLRDLHRFYRQTSADAGRGIAEDVSLGDYLDAGGYGHAFQQDHLLPMAAAIWSTPAGRVRDYPVAAFIRFCANHGLLQFTGRPIWRTVTGGSRAYVNRLTASYADRIRLGHDIVAVRPVEQGVEVRDRKGGAERFDHVVIAAHADQALAMLEPPTARERALLGAFAYTENRTVLHQDTALMPKRRSVWASWNYTASRRQEADAPPCVTYWMNRLQGIPAATPRFVTLNPSVPPDPAKTLMRQVYEHPVFDAAAIAAQRQLWSLQGVRRVWFCGAYFGSGFHEDGLQSGLAVAEALGGVRRPWSVPNESGRIVLSPSLAPAV